MKSCALVLCLLMAQAVQCAAETWMLESRASPYDDRRPSPALSYAPLQKARKTWRLCASYPHLKDSYWLSVNYGMVEHARRLGVSLEIVEAGGYLNLEKQKAQIAACAKTADALIVGTVSYDRLTPLLRDLSRRKPVIAAVNDIANEGITAKAGVSWVSMGESIGRYFAARHPKGSATVKVAWFPGPKGAGWVNFVEEGFNLAMRESSADIVAVKYGDTGFEAQLLLLEELLEQHPDVDYVIGSAVTADAAVSLLRAKKLTGKVGVLADYFTHGTYRAIRRGKVMAAPTDSPVLQGRLAIDQAVRALEGTLTLRHAGPAIRMIDETSIQNGDIAESLAPAWFKPTFAVGPDTLPASP